MNIDERLCQYLKEAHCGEENAILSRNLESAFEIKGTQVREIINQLRESGEPICSSANGYFYARTEEELEHTARQLKSRIKKISRAERGIRKALQKFTDSGQISLPFDAEELHPV